MTTMINRLKARFEAWRIKTGWSDKEVAAWVLILIIPWYGESVFNALYSYFFR